MPPEAFLSEDPSHWLQYAKSDLALASGPRLPDVFLQLYCFHAQQCPEKAVKAVMIHRRLVYQKTHDIELLLAMLEAKGETIPPTVKSATELTRFAVSARYPMIPGEPTGTDLDRAVEMAQTVYEWATDAIKRT
jgi:HEPN domain-containing protein